MYCRLGSMIIREQGVSAELESLTSLANIKIALECNKKDDKEDSACDGQVGDKILEDEYSRAH